MFLLSLDSLEDDRIAMKEAGLQTLLEEQNKLAAEKEGKVGNGTSTATATATADGVNKVRYEKIHSLYVLL